MSVENSHKFATRNVSAQNDFLRILRFHDDPNKIGLIDS